jgi:protein-disulfide isomerase
MEPTSNTTSSLKNNLLIPLSIIIAGAFIAGALIYVKKTDPSTNLAASLAATHNVDITVNPVTDADHILGNPNASVMMLEYSDTECPFCQRYQPIMHKIIDNFGKDGKVAWAYRHFVVHKDFAPKESEALECVAELGGDTKFFQYLDTLFEKRKFPASATDTYVNIDPKDLPAFAQDIGLDRSAFTQCLSSGKYQEKIQLQYKDAIAAGALGTPHTVIFSKKPLTREAKDFVDTVNTQLLTQMGAGSSAPFAISKDNKMVLVSGAMDYAIMSQLVQMVIRSNS